MTFLRPFDQYVFNFFCFWINLIVDEINLLQQRIVRAGLFYFSEKNLAIIEKHRLIICSEFQCLFSSNPFTRQTATDELQRGEETQDQCNSAFRCIHNFPC